jgi:predicted RNase H-related nuclease YkuK (DUF458 family)
MKLFRTLSGEKVDIVKHTLDIIKKDPYVEIHIGTDSQNKGDHTQYAVVIAYRYGTRGVHYIYHKEKVNRIRDRFTKLFKEAELTIEVAEWLSKKIPSIKPELDFDYNDDQKFFSQKLVSSVKGWAESLGYKTNIKPNNQIATKAADYQCR